jgi:hypothetical protein
MTVRLILLTTLVAVQPLAAQQDSGLAQLDSGLLEAVRLVTEGQGDSARSLVRGRLAATPPADTSYAAVLYAAGVVAGALDSAAFYLRRVSIEYPRSAWADRALLRLAQQLYGAGDLDGARRAAERVRTDYPVGPAAAEATFWAARVYLDRGDVGTACRYLIEAAEGAVADIELTNRIGYHQQRCASAPAPVAADTATPPAPARAMFAVQVAAVGTAQAADDAMRQMAAEGFDSHVVRDADGLFKVRVGRFADRAEAQAMLRRLRQAFGGQPFVVEER